MKPLNPHPLCPLEFLMFFPASGSTPLDPDVVTYFAAIDAAGGTYDPSAKTAYNTFVVTGKAQGWYSKQTAAWPYIGGNAASHAIDAINPGGPYTMTWNGTLTHDAFGVTPNGTTGYGNTGMNINTLFNTTRKFSLIYYTYDTGSQGGSGARCAIGAGATPVLRLFVDTFFDSITRRNHCAMISTTASATAFNSYSPFTWAGGLFIGTRNSSTDIKLYLDGTQIGTSATAEAGTALPSINLYAFAFNNNGTANSFMSHSGQYMAVGTEMSPTDASNMSAAMTTLQTALGRQYVPPEGG